MPDGWFLPRSALNDLQIETLMRLLAHASRANEIDCKLRKDGHDFWYEADFIKHMRPYSPTPT